MHAFKRYYNFKAANKTETKKWKKNFLSKYYPWISHVFITLENLINTIDVPDGNVLTNSEVTYFGKVLTEMYACEIEDELESMLVAITKLTKLQVRIWRRLNKDL